MATRTERLFRLSVLALLEALLVGASAPQVQTRTVRFEAGSSSARIAGTIKGDQTIDYLLAAKEGQRLRVSLKSKNSSTYFNLISPGETDVAFFIGSNADTLNHFDGIVPATGTTRIRVYLYRAAARRREVADYRLDVVLTARR